MRVNEFITGHVIYNPAYTYKFQLKTTLVLALVLSSPQALTSHYDVVYLPDVKPAIRWSWF